MRILDQTKSYEIFAPDLELGYLKNDVVVVKHHARLPKIEEIGHFEINSYANGGKERVWVVDVKGQEERKAYDETEQIQVYIRYTESELAEHKINALKEKLRETDYQAIKFAEGVMSESEYAPIKAQRQEWRAEINSLQSIYGI